MSCGLSISGKGQSSVLCEFWGRARSSAEFPFAHPNGANPFFARFDRSSSVEEALVRKTELVAVVGEERGIAAPWKDGASQLGEDGRAALRAIIEVDDGGGQTLAAARELSLASGKLGVEGVLVGKVFLSWEVAQNLQSFNVRLRASECPAGAGAQSPGGWMVDVMQRGAFAGSGAVDLIGRLGVIGHGRGAFEPGSPQFNDGEAFFGADDVFNQGDFGIRQMHQHARALPVRAAAESKKLSPRRREDLGRLLGAVDALEA